MTILPLLCKSSMWVVIPVLLLCLETSPCLFMALVWLYMGLFNPWIICSESYSCFRVVYSLVFFFFFLISLPQISLSLSPWLSPPFCTIISNRLPSSTSRKSRLLFRIYSGLGVASPPSSTSSNKWYRSYI